MELLVSRIKSIRYLPWILLGFGIVYLATTWIFKRPFIWGDSWGPYWLFVAIDWTVLPLTLLSLLGLLGAAAILLRRLIRSEPSVRSAALAGALLLVSSLSFLGACFPALISPITPLESLTMRGRVYYLSCITALIDNNYALFECDGFGLMCRQVYRSGDYSLAEPMQAGLAYEATTNTLSIEVSGHGTIHTYHP